jgi:hypothetical protein
MCLTGFSADKIATIQLSRELPPSVELEVVNLDLQLHDAAPFWT